ncbi:MAG: lysylphosphatidylglycerol synthase transmembrane domain-containing protein [Anaerolineae bacterium]
MSERIWNRSLLLTAIAVAIISVASVWVAWQAAPDLGTRVASLALLPILAAAFVSYALRAVRFHYFLTHSGVAIPFRGTIVVQAVGFALSVTPGHIGEVFKLHLIRERSGTPVVQTAPLLVLDRVTEGGGFLVLAVVSTLLLPALRAQLPAPVVILLGLAVMLAIGLLGNRWRRHLPATPAWLARNHLWQRVAPHLQHLVHGLEASFTPGQIAGGIALTAVARFADGLVVLFAARLLGLELALPVATFILAVSGLAGGISLLPAGTGAVETTMVGLLVLSGAPLANALTITLLARLATLWLWVAFGLMVALVLQVRNTPANRERFEQVGGE